MTLPPFFSVCTPAAPITSRQVVGKLFLSKFSKPSLAGLIGSIELCRPAIAFFLGIILAYIRMQLFHIAAVQLLQFFRCGSFFQNLDIGVIAAWFLLSAGFFSGIFIGMLALSLLLPAAIVCARPISFEVAAVYCKKFTKDPQRFPCFCNRSHQLVSHTDSNSHNKCNRRRKQKIIHGFER